MVHQTVTKIPRSSVGVSRLAQQQQQKQWEHLGRGGGSTIGAIWHIGASGSRVRMQRMGELEDVMSLRLEDKEMHLLPKTRCESPRQKK